MHQHPRALPVSRQARGRRQPLATVLKVALAAALGGSRGFTPIAEWDARLTQAQLKRLRARYDRLRRERPAPADAGAP